MSALGESIQASKEQSRLEIKAAALITRVGRNHQLRKKGRQEREALRILAVKMYAFLGRWKRWRQTRAGKVSRGLL